MFKSFAELAGVPDKDRGAVVGNLKIRPLAGLVFTVHDSYVPDIFNTFYVDGEYTWKATPDLTLRIGGQYTDQRSVGQELTTSSAFPEWLTNVGGGTSLSPPRTPRTPGFAPETPSACPPSAP